MKGNYLIIAMSLQVGESSNNTEINNLLDGIKQANYKEVLTITSGRITIDEHGQLLISKLADVYGESILTDFVHHKTDDEETITFKKKYISGSQAILHYQLTKVAAIYLGIFHFEGYFGHFQVEGYGKESEGWCKWQLIPIEDSFFDMMPETFQQEMLAEIKRRDLKM